jgi:hypothetical protein
MQVADAKQPRRIHQLGADLRQLSGPAEIGRTQELERAAFHQPVLGLDVSGVDVAPLRKPRFVGRIILYK